MRYDGSEAIKNMDDVMMHGRTLEELEKKLKVFLKYCEEKNLKLKPSKWSSVKKLNSLEQQSEQKRFKKMMLYISYQEKNGYTHSWNRRNLRPRKKCKYGAVW